MRVFLTFIYLFKQSFYASHQALCHCNIVISLIYYSITLSFIEFATESADFTTTSAVSNTSKTFSPSSYYTSDTNERQCH